ncbi:MAG: ComEC family competence protein [candidate division Zixibacteria bacterium]|nr:ComEC family competence protein [candidate division Zixibacteria bacterium]
MTRKYPSVFLLAFVVPGIALADCSRLPSEYFLLLALVSCLAGFAALQRHCGVAALMLGLSFGSISGFHYAIEHYDMGPSHLENLLDDGHVYQIYGQVSDWPELTRSGTEIKVRLDSLSSDVTRSAQGSILLKVSDSSTALQRGDRLKFKGRIYSVKGNRWPSGFDYRRYLNLKGVFGITYLPTLNSVRLDTKGRSTLHGLVDRLRSAMTASFRRNVSPVGAALASGFLIGEIRHIPPDVYQWFRDSGTLHLLAVSGSNVALVILFVIVIVRPFSLSRRYRAAILCAVVFIFTLLSYGEPSVVRASIMAVLVIAAGLVGRRYDLNQIIGLTALIILLWDPAQLYDVGFQLSFATAWGLILAVPRVGRFFEAHRRRTWYRWLVFPLIVTTVAQICSAPLIALYFQRIPVISLLANLVIVPLVSVAVVGSLVLLLADLVLPVAGAFVGSLLNYLFNAVLFALEQFGGEGIHVYQTGNLPVTATIAAYLFLVLLIFALTTKALRRALVLLVLVSVNALLLTHLLLGGNERDRTRLHVFSVPGGLASVISRPEAREGDLLITSLVGRQYPVDERILAPALRKIGVDRIGAFIVQWAEYSAIDDLLRLARDYGAVRVHVATGIRNSFMDVNNFQGILADSVDIVGFAPSDDNTLIESGGYHAGTGCLRAEVGPVTVLWTGEPAAGLLRRASARQQTVLVVDRPFRPCQSDFAELAEAGCSAIICSEIEQCPRPDDSKATGSPDDSARPDFVIDLTRVGATLVTLYDDPSRYVAVTPLP